MSTISRAERRYTPNDLLKAPEGKAYELTDGRLEMKQVSGESSGVAVELASLLRVHCRIQPRPGRVFGPDCGYLMFPDQPNRLRRPDVSFIAAGRITKSEYVEGYFRLAPDLAVEVVSPKEPARKLLGHVLEYLAAGVRLAWVIEPSTRSAFVFRADRSASVLGVDDELTGDDVVSGFQVKLGDLFPSDDDLI